MQKEPQGSEASNSSPGSMRLKGPDSDLPLSEERIAELRLEVAQLQAMRYQIGDQDTCDTSLS